MRIFKKILLSSLCFVLVVTLLSVAIIAPAIHNESGYYHDAGLRRSLSGTVDYIVLGASHALAAFVPSILDEKMGCNCYNLSGSMMPASSKYVLLKKELDRNPVETVVLELSYDTLARDTSHEYADGASVTVQRLDSFAESIEFMLRYVPLDDWLNLYSRLLVSGMVYWQDVLSGDSASQVSYATKGYHPTKASDISLSAEQARNIYHSAVFSTDYDGAEAMQIAEIIELCHEKGIRVIITVTPVADSLIWEYGTWDKFERWMQRFSEENGCEFYDFNLLKTRYMLFSDHTSFYDGAHMSGEGAAAFSEAFAEIMNWVNAGEDVSSDFYSSYAEMVQDSPYMTYCESGTEPE